MKLVRSTINGEHFLETPARLWSLFFEAWQIDHSHPMPMPLGHKMFSTPQYYHVVPYTDIPENMLILAAQNVLQKAGAFDEKSQMAC